MARIALIGGSYQSESPNADCEYTQNFMPEAIESGMGASAMALYRSPGTSLFVNLAGMNAVYTGLYFQFGTTPRAFVIAQNLENQYLWEIFANGTAINRGVLGIANRAASMAVNNSQQLMACSSGTLWIFNLATNVLTQLDTTSGAVLIGPVQQIAFSDGFFIALIQNSQTLQVSSLLNGSAAGWSPLNFTILSVVPDQITSILVDHREVWAWTQKQTIPYFDAGAPIFPYLPVPGGFIEQGLIAPASPIKLDNSVMWIGGDERGYGVAWRANGYVPTRISNHPIETQWQAFPKITDAIGYAFQDRGHSIAHWYFPSANKSFRYDVATGLWHNVTYNNSGIQAAHSSRCHFMAFNLHLVGDWQTGNIYQMSAQFLTDNGNLIQRVRRGAPVAAELDFMHLDRFRVFVETGLGPQPPLVDGNGNPRDPQMYYRDSRDGGHDWSDPMALDCGQAGEFRKLVEMRRLGRARWWCPEISMTDPIDWKIIDGFLDAPGADFAPHQQRLAKKLAQVA
jgi:hypothetical protein